MLGHRLSSIVVAYILIGFSNGGHVPNIPTGRRTQYMFLLDNGGYKYGYDTGSGSSEKALANEANQVIGSYSYQSPSGLVSVDYTSGVEGFKPTKVVIPQASESQWKTYGNLQTTANVQRFPAGLDSVVTYAATPSYQHTPTIVQPYSGFVATGVKSVQSDSYSQAESNTGDASYSFGYNAGDHDRQETSDAAGNVVGSYSFVGTDGQTKKVDYVAGAGKGFIAKGNHLPDVSQVHQTSAIAGQYTPVQSYTPVSYASGHHSYAPISYAGSSGYVTSGHIPVAQEYSGESKGDASYSFGYNAGDHDRQETSDAAGNVVGSYSFVGTDGQTKKVDYVAGAGKGFIAQGDHLPKVSQVYQTSAITGQYTPVQSYTPVNYASGHHSYAPISYAGSSGYVTSGHIPLAQQYSGESKGDASYSFSYNAGDHNRQESSDAEGNVVGSYSFLGTDGQTKKVDYVAGAEKGFIAKGNHLPEAPKVYQTVQSYSPVNYAAHTGQSYSHEQNQAGGDASYSFSYNAGDHNRQETSDAAGNVVGSYSFVGTDGQTKKVDYLAGPEKGFIAKGNHLPDVSQGSSSGYSAHTQASSLGNHKAGGVSYSFSYNTGDHASGSVIGTEGQSKKVDYNSGAGKLFSAKGHLPEVQRLFLQNNQPSVNAATNTQVQQYSLGNVNVKTLLTPNSHRKVGYIFDSL